MSVEWGNCAVGLWVGCGKAGLWEWEWGAIDVYGYGTGVCGVRWIWERDDVWDGCMYFGLVCEVGVRWNWCWVGWGER
jgi:hypothetical protein